MATNSTNFSFGKFGIIREILRLVILQPIFPPSSQDEIDLRILPGQFFVLRFTSLGWNNKDAAILPGTFGQNLGCGDGFQRTEKPTMTADLWRPSS